jgi:predicted AlkP superfamily pyrophosphatase or phosphodiesterase
VVILVGVMLLPIWGQAPRRGFKLVLVISVDQMRFDYLTRFGSLYKGGLRRLLDQGAVFSRAMVRHAVTDTGPGHAVILSGRHPSHTGMIADRWFDASLKKVIGLVEDPKHSALGGRGGSYSPSNFIGTSLGDALKERSPNSRVVALSLRERCAILMAGQRGDAAYWYEAAAGNFVTSTYYMSQAPPWLDQWNRQRFPDRYAGQLWTRLLPDAKLYEKYAGRDDIEGEWDRRDIRFPHHIRGKPPETRFYDDLRRTPFADEMTLDVALEALKGHELGKDESTDILAVGFAATDVIGHTYGANSQEVMDQLLTLDRTLEKLFQAVEKSVGLAQTLVVLTSNHGALPLVEVLQDKGLDARRASPTDLESVVQKELGTRFPAIPGLVAHYDAPNFYLDEAVMERHQLRREDVEATITKALLSTDLVEAVYTHSLMLSSKRSSDPYVQLFRNSFYQPRSPHLMVRLKKYIYLNDRMGGTGHGSPYDYDRHVPIVFMGTKIKPGKYGSPCGLEDITPTLARLLGFEYPQEPGSRFLSEMIR